MFRHPIAGLASLQNPIGTIYDKLLLGWLRTKLLIKSDDDILKGPEMSTMEKLIVKNLFLFFKKN